MAPSISFLTLSRDEQLLIYNKMENRELAAVASSCRDAYEFTEKNVKTLSSRPAFGTSFTLWGTPEGTIVCANSLCEYEEGYQFRIPVEEDFYEKMALISAWDVNIRIQDNSLIPRVVEIFKKWNPPCYRICFEGDIPLMTRVEMAEVSRTAHPTWLTCDPILFMETKDTLKESPKAGMFYIDMHGLEWNEDGMFESVRHFSGLNSKTTPEYITKFLTDLANSEDIGNLKSSDFEYDYIPLEGLKENTLHVPYKLWIPEAKLLFIQYAPIGYRKYPSWTIQKLPLKNNLCALVDEMERTSASGIKRVRVEIIHDNEEEIFECLLKRMKICKEYFSGEHKKRYLQMNDSERLNELLKQFCWHNQVLRTEFHENCIYMLPYY